MSKYASALVLNKGTSLVFILIFTGVVLFDSTIVEFSSYSGLEFPSSLNIEFFTILSIIFVAIGIILLNSTRKDTPKDAHTQGRISLRYFYLLISSVQILTVVIILITIFQMLTLNKYDLILLRIEAYLSHLSAFVFLAFLVFLFAGWLLTTKRSYVIILYTISLILASVNLVISVIYLDSYLSNAPTSYVKPYPVVSYVTNLPGTSTLTESLSVVFDVLSLCSFLLMWISTAIFLSQYRQKMGKIKYFSLMALPLIYYIFPLQGYFGDAFFSLLQSSPVSYSIIYIVIFSATKQVGAVLFSLTFWTASSLIYNNRIRKSLIISSIGMAILFGTFEIAPLQYHVYPPYGFITQAYIPLGTYLLLVGIFSSAKVISRDSSLRKEFYKSASSQLSLLKTIGVSQMEKELENQVEFVQKLSKLSEKEEDLHLVEESYLDEENAKQILHDVLDELYSKAKKEEYKNS